MVGYEKAPATQKVARGRLYDDARQLVGSKSIVEKHYADYSNSIKDLANRTRLEMLAVPKLKRNPSARKAYAAEVESLEAKLRLVEMKAPLERKAQRATKAVVKLKRVSNPDVESEELKKLERTTLRNVRARLGLKKLDIQFTDREWEAIQAGAVSENRLKQILAKADMNQVQKLATPSTRSGITGGQKNRALALIKNKYTLQEVADELGVSVAVLKEGIK